MIRITYLLLVFILFFGYSNPIFAQNPHVEYGYDNCGNRITRQVILVKTTNHNQADSSENSIFNRSKTYTETIDNYNIYVFPNPNKGKFKIVINGDKNMAKCSIFLHTVNGALVFKEQDVDKETIVDIKNYQDGAYILTIIINEEKKTWKIIKE